MRPSILLAVAVLAAAATVASAASISVHWSYAGNVWTGNEYASGYCVAGISDDGTAIMGNRGGATPKCTVIETATNLNLWQSSANGYAARGIGKWDGGYFNGAAYNVSGKPGARGMTNAGGAWVCWDSAGVNNVSAPAALNNVSVYQTTGNGWMIGHGMNAHAGYGMAWKIVNGDMQQKQANWDQNMGTDWKVHGLNGVSNAGIAVGTSASSGPVLCDLNNNSAGSITAIPEFSGDYFENSGEGLALSAGAVLGAEPAGYAGGWAQPYVDMFNPDPYSDDKQHGWRYELGSAAVEALLPVGGDIDGDVQYAKVFDIADNGYAVGYSENFTQGTGRVATVWLPGETEGRDLNTWLVELGVEMPADYISLQYATSITATANGGEYQIAGKYLSTDPDLNAVKAFACSVPVPEPGALTLLTLGLTFVMRRRRR